MKPFFSVMFLSIGLLSFCNDTFAELSLEQNRLTLHVQTVALEDVLQELSQEGGFRVTILEKQATDNVTVTEHFDALPIEEGLSRLLAHWNYGLTKQRGSGRIQTVFLASKRMKPEDLPPTALRATSTRYTDPSESRSEYSEAMTPFSADNAYSEEQDNEEFESEESDSEDGTPFTEDMLPPDLPPDIREAMMEDL